MSAAEAPAARGSVPGDNLPPAYDHVAFSAHETNIGDLFDEAKNFCDGEPIADQATADKAQALMRMLQEAGKAADVQRVTDNEPFDAGKAKVQAAYAPLISDTKTVRGKVPLAVEAIKKYLNPWLVKLQAERDAEARRLREEAAAAAQAAADAARAASAANDLAAQEAAEQKVAEARAAEKAATRAEGNTAKASGGYGRASGLRDNWKAEMVDPVAAARWAWADHRTECEAFFLKLAQADVAAGRRKLDGFSVINEPVVV